MGSEMFELCDTSHYFVFRPVALMFSSEFVKKKEEKLEEKRSGTKNLLRREAISAAVFKLYDA